ncbi:uncharacterized protein K452DRAFT_286601 [Aplosporella prunicola CBS 121167]|uniref:Peptidyl-tRNA hydrolase n=1 Tax=Aplosporella prunicola CBS 121167 TaxID=1176127 RepID=A0A6A6BH95_9PEZI|nr:uncharacterized protein K452DRAFT_286601 [Aplosporella prunicola CBS 121167]KAF2142968.1 hypothetical protein K452DRAFT_286601 [Aplosporella prunicola CBS 121167]
MAGRPGKIVPLFIASIGNPAPAYANTLHSAGHTALEQIRVVRGFAPFRKDSAAGAAGRGGLISRQSDPVAPGFSWLPGILAPGSSKTDRLGREPVKEGEEDWTLWQSTSLMNVSGKGLGQAYGKWKRANKEGQLVVLHDELEKALGKATFRRGGSAR